MNNKEKKIREQLQFCSIEQLEEISRVTKLMAEEQKTDLAILKAFSKR